MGKPRQWDEPEVKSIIQKHELIAKKYNKLIGFHVIQPDFNLVLNKIEKGYDFIAFSLDSLFLSTIARN